MRIVLLLCVQFWQVTRAGSKDGHTGMSDCDIVQEHATTIRLQRSRLQCSRLQCSRHLENLPRDLRAAVVEPFHCGVIDDNGCRILIIRQFSHSAADPVAVLLCHYLTLPLGSVSGCCLTQLLDHFCCCATLLLDHSVAMLLCCCAHSVAGSLSLL